MREKDLDQASDALLKEMCLELRAENEALVYENEKLKERVYGIEGEEILRSLLNKAAGEFSVKLYSAFRHVMQGYWDQTSLARREELAEKARHIMEDSKLPIFPEMYPPDQQDKRNSVHAELVAKGYMTKRASDLVARTERDRAFDQERTESRRRTKK